MYSAPAGNAGLDYCFILNIGKTPISATIEAYDFNGFLTDRNVETPIVRRAGNRGWPSHHLYPHEVGGTSGSATSVHRTNGRTRRPLAMGVSMRLR